MGILLLDNVASTGPGVAYSYKRAFSEHTVQSEMGGTVIATDVTLDLEGSLDGITWFQLQSHAFSVDEIAAQGAMFHVTGKLVEFIRLNLITLTGGTSPTIKGTYIGF